jgi:hypothetical protein
MMSCLISVIPSSTEAEEELGETVAAIPLIPVLGQLLS